MASLLRRLAIAFVCALVLHALAVALIPRQSAIEAPKEAIVARVTLARIARTPSPRPSPTPAPRATMSSRPFPQASMRASNASSTRARGDRRRRKSCTQHRMPRFRAAARARARSMVPVRAASQQRPETATVPERPAQVTVAVPSCAARSTSKRSAKRSTMLTRDSTSARLWRRYITPMAVRRGFHSIGRGSTRAKPTIHSIQIRRTCRFNFRRSISAQASRARFNTSSRTRGQMVRRR